MQTQITATRGLGRADTLRPLWVHAHRPSFTDLQGHGAGYDVPGCQVLCDRSVALHEPLALTVDKDASLSTAPFRDETASTVYACKQRTD